MKSRLVRINKPESMPKKRRLTFFSEINFAINKINEIDKNKYIVIEEIWHAE